MLTAAWEKLQSDLHCCGVANVTDGNLAPGRISTACCINEENDCDVNNLNEIYSTPCFDAIFGYFQNAWFIMGICCVVLGVLDVRSMNIPHYSM